MRMQRVEARGARKVTPQGVGGRGRHGIALACGASGPRSGFDGGSNETLVVTSPSGSEAALMEDARRRAAWRSVACSAALGRRWDPNGTSTLPGDAVRRRLEAHERSSASRRSGLCLVENTEKLSSPPSRRRSNGGVEAPFEPANPSSSKTIPVAECLRRNGWEALRGLPLTRVPKASPSPRGDAGCRQGSRGSTALGGYRRRAAGRPPSERQGRGR